MKSSHADFHHSSLMFRAKSQQGMWDTHLVVEIGLGLQHIPLSPKHRGCHILCGGFAIRASDGNHWHVESIPIASGNFPIGCKGISRGSQHIGISYALKLFIGTVRAHQYSGSSLFHSGLHEIFSVEPLTLQGNEKIPLFYFSGISNHISEKLRIPLCHHLTPCSTNNFLSCKFHLGHYILPAIASRATSLSSK